MNLTVPILLGFVLCFPCEISSSSRRSKRGPSTSSSSTDSDSSDTLFGPSVKEHPPFHIFLPYRMDYLAEMKLTTIFPRKFLFTLRDYEKSKNSGERVLSLPYCPSGAVKLGQVHLPNRKNMNNFLEMMEELSRRVYRTGLNKITAGGNFRLPIKGLYIEPGTNLVYTNIEIDFPTDSYSRYIKFVKTLYYRLAKSNLTYRVNEGTRLNRIVLGKIKNIDEVDLKKFEKTFKDFQIGFLTIGKIIVTPPGRRGDRFKSIFYFDHNSYEPIIGIENTVEEEWNVNSEDLFKDVIPDKTKSPKESKKQKKSKSKSKQHHEKDTKKKTKKKTKKR